MAIGQDFPTFKKVEEGHDCQDYGQGKQMNPLRDGLYDEISVCQSLTWDGDTNGCKCSHVRICVWHTLIIFNGVRVQLYWEDVVLKQHLRGLHQGYGDNCGKGIDVTLFTLHGSVHESTRFTPFELMLGCTPRGLLDVIKEGWDHTWQTWTSR